MGEGGGGNLYYDTRVERLKEETGKLVDYLFTCYLASSHGRGHYNSIWQLL